MKKMAPNAGKCCLFSKAEMFNTKLIFAFISEKSYLDFFGQSQRLKGNVNIGAQRGHFFNKEFLEN